MFSSGRQFPNVIESPIAIILYLSLLLGPDFYNYVTRTISIQVRRREAGAVPTCITNQEEVYL